LLGEKGALLAGIAGSCTALVSVALVKEGWMVFPLMPLFALGGIGVPALQSMATRVVDESRQGQFQGVLASVVSLASIVSPLAFSSIYFVVRPHWPGAIWLSAALVYVIVIPIVFTLWFRTGTEAKPV
jgi:DHA1 family tetracycline resistance protein-like MFS transporter